jgi:hypothetical protein
VRFKTLMGLIAKGAKCSVKECGEDGVRSLTASKVEGTGVGIPNGLKKAILCKEHYKEWKKATKGERDTEKARFSRF